MCVHSQGATQWNEVTQTFLLPLQGLQRSWVQ